MGIRCQLEFPIVSQLSNNQILSFYSKERNYASAPYGSSTSLYGLTFVLQWDTALKANPHHITISGWNEYFAGAWHNPWQGYAKSVGLNGKDNRLFVDLYGAYRSRDIEPTHEYGNMYYDIMQSCIRVRNLNLHNNRNDCSVGNEICCQLEKYRQFVQIYSYIKNDKKDYILSNTHQEKEGLMKMNYKEICVFNPSTNQFCISGKATDPIVGISGPFDMYSKDGPNRKPLYRCKKGDSHFISLHEDCEKQKMEHRLGYVSTKKDSLFARSISRCITKDGVHYHALDDPCHTNDTMESLLGFVI